MSEAVAGVVGEALAVAVLDVCRAAAGSAKGRRSVSGLARRMRDAGHADAAEEIASLCRDGKPAASPVNRTETTDGVWLTGKRAAGKIGERELRAGVDIRRAVAARFQSGAVVPAVDPSRVVVDTSVGKAPTSPSGGAVHEEREFRYEAWLRDVTERPVERRVLRGRVGSMRYDAIVRSVLCDGESTRTLDVRLGVGNGRCERLVLAELRVYADLARF